MGRNPRMIRAAEDQLERKVNFRINTDRHGSGLKCEGHSPSKDSSVRLPQRGHRERVGRSPPVIVASENFSRKAGMTTRGTNRSSRSSLQSGVICLISVLET